MRNENQESACTWPMSDKMRSGKGSRASGRPIDSDFESAVLAKAILGKKHGMHALNDIVLAGMATASEDPFCHRTKVKFLKFSKCWARGLLMRHASFPQQQQQQQHPTLPANGTVVADGSAPAPAPDRHRQKPVAGAGFHECPVSGVSTFQPSLPASVSFYRRVFQESFQDEDPITSLSSDSQTVAVASGRFMTP